MGGVAVAEAVAARYGAKMGVNAAARGSAYLAHARFVPTGAKVKLADFATKHGRPPCFVAGTPVLLDEKGASKNIEDLRGFMEVGDDCDHVLSRDQFDPDGPLTLQRVLEVHVRDAHIWNVYANNMAIGTTEEHPFYIVGRGWVSVNELREAFPSGGLTGGSKELPAARLADNNRSTAARSSASPAHERSRNACRSPAPSISKA